MAISTNGTVIARLAGGLYNTVMSNATYLEVAAQDPSTLANTLYARDFAKSTDLAVATTLLANLGLAGQAGLDSWVAAQLTAAGAANKGAKIVSLLNDFAGLASDATWGTYATAFNTKVDAALAASQKTGATSGVFADAGTVAVANATFTLTTGVDGLDKFTGGAGNDSFVANNAALGTLDSIDGGTGTDSLTITDTASIPKLVIAAKDIETLSAKSTEGSVGQVAAAATIAAKQVISYNVAGLSWATGGSYTLNVGGVKKTLTAPTGAGDNTFAKAMALAIENALDEGVGAATWTPAQADITGTTFTVTSATAGVALPSISLVKLSGDTAGTLTTTSATYLPAASQVANQVTAAAVASSTFSVPADVTTATVSAATTANVGSVKTAATTVSGTDVTLSGGLSQTITASGSVYASGSTGAVVVTGSAVGGSSSNGIYVASSSTTGNKNAFGTSADITAKGTLVTGGSTVTITNAGATISSSAISSGTANGNEVRVGSDANVGVSAANASTGKETILNSALTPTGNVSVTVANDFTNTATKGGVKDVALGNGPVTVYTNGGTTASVKGATTVTVKDLGTTPLKADAAAAQLPGTSNLTTVNLDGLNGADPAATLTSDALTNVKVINSKGTTTLGVTVTNNTAAHALNLTVGNTGVSGKALSVTDSKATSVSIASEASAYGYVNDTEVTSGSGSFVRLVTPLATSVSFTNGQAVTLDQSAAAQVDKVTTINASGAGKITVDTTNTTTWAKLTAIDASTSSGAVTATITANQSFKGGSGNDSVSIAAVPNYTVDGGAGTNKIVITNSAALTGLATSVTNFQTLGLGADLTAAAGAYSSISIDSATNTSTVTGAKGAAVTVANAKYAGASLTLSNLEQDKIGLTVNLGTSDATLKGAATAQGVLTLASTTADTTTGHTTHGIESITINSSGISNKQVASGGTNAGNTFTYASADALKTLVITGDSDITVSTGGTVASKVNSIDASAATGDVTVTSVVLRATGATIKGGSGALTATGSAGADTISVGAGGGTITGSAGGDTIALATEQTGVTTLAYANGGTSSVSAYDVISGFQNYTGTAGALSDKIDFSGTAAVLANVTSTTQAGTTGIYYTAKDGIVTWLTSTGAASTVTSAAALLTAAVAIVDGTANSTVAFQLGSDTYVAHGGTTTGADATVVELVGVSGLTSVATTAGTLALLIG